MSNRITQKKSAFYKLWKEKKGGSSRFIPTWEFLGEMLIKELNEWVLMSYKCPTRLTDLFQENPSLLERKMLEGKSGAQYYGYRLRPGATPKDIKDEIILSFYKQLNSKKDGKA